MTNYDVFVVPPLAVPHQKPPNKLRSHLYPTLITESITMKADISGVGYMLASTIESLVVDASVHGSGIMRSVLNQYVLPAENIQIDAKVQGVGELILARSLLNSYKLANDVLSINAQVSDSGILKRVLIQQSLKPELIVFNAAMIGEGVMQ